MIYNNFFPNFPPQSKVWIYSADRILEETEGAEMQKDIDAFTTKWQAHGIDLKATGSLLYNNILILVVDESVEAPSGCSIDGSVHFIKALNNKYGVNFLNRNHVAVLKDSEVNIVSINEKEQLKGQTVLNTSCHTLADINAKLFIDFKDSAYARLATNEGFSLTL
ncbi:MAG: hypothetical protein H6578_03825 [Chitinophagales bacterium]|nr:hypothetical protein [Chitinophagales bacterium]